MKKIAVLIPHFQQEKYLSALIESLLNQDYPNLHLIFSNDGSIDKSDDILRKYFFDLTKKYQVQTYSHLFNLGGEGRENVSWLSKQIPEDVEYTAIIDGDDFIKDPSRFTKQVKILEDNLNIGAVHSDVTALYQNGEIVEAFWKKFRSHQTPGNSTIPQGNITKDLIHCNFIYTCSLLVRTELYKKAFNYDLFTKLGIFLGDYAGVLRLSKLTNIAYIDEPLAYYRVISTSSSHNNRERIVKDTSRLQQLAINGVLFEDL